MSAKQKRAKAAKMVELSQASIRRLVVELHNEIHYLRWCEGEAGEASLAELQAHYAATARDVAETGAEVGGWAGGILEQLDTLGAMAALMGKKG